MDDYGAADGDAGVTRAEAATVKQTAGIHRSQIPLAIDVARTSSDWPPVECYFGSLQWSSRLGWRLQQRVICRKCFFHSLQRKGRMLEGERSGQTNGSTHFDSHCPPNHTETLSFPQAGPAS